MAGVVDAAGDASLVVGRVEEDAAVQRARARRRVVQPRTVVLVASLGVFMAFVDATIVNVAIPSIHASFHGASISSLSWVLNAYNLVFAAFLIPAGRVSDLIGRKRMFELGIVVFTVASVLCGVANSLAFLDAARVLQAAGAAIMVPASLALVLQSAEAGRRAHSVALWSSAAAVAAGVGPALGGVLVHFSDWRLVFFVNVPVGIVALLASKRKLVESRAPGRRVVPDFAGAGVLAACLAVLTLGIVQGEEWGWTSAADAVCFATAVILGAYFIRRCAWHRAPLFELSLLRERSLMVANGLSLLAAAGYFSYLLANVLFLTSVWGYSVLQAGLALTPGPFVAAAVAAPLGNIVDSRGYRFVIVPGAAVWCGGVVLLITRMGSSPDFMGDWLPAIIVLGVGAGATLPTLGAAAVAAAPGGRFATATGLNSVSRQMGAVLGVAVLIAIIGTPAPSEVVHAFHTAWGLAAGCFLAVAALAPLLGPIASQHELSLQEREAQRPVLAIPEPPPLPEPTQPQPLPMPQTPAQMLAEVPIFAGLSDHVREEIAGRGSLTKLSGGEWLFRKDDPGDSLYVVLAGRCELIDGEGHVFMVIGRGSVLGELALLTGSPRAASVRAVRDAELLRLSQDQFEQLLREQPAFVLGLTRELGRQVQASRPRSLPSAPHAASIVLVPLTDEAPVRPIAEALVASIGRWEPISLVGDSRSLTPAMLDELERQSARALLVADRPDLGGEETLRLLQQADRVLAVAAADQPPDWLDRHPKLQNCDLVLCDGAFDSQGSAGAWLDALSPRATHRLREHVLFNDAARLARRLVGRSPGIVLSGGGARGFAHIGAIEELLRAGVPLDRVGGTSMGAFIGALYAQGMDADELDAHCYEEWVRRSPLTDYRIPRASLIKAVRVREMFMRLLPGTIEALPLDFFCVSCDLVDGAQVAHRRGSLAHAVSASMCLPGLCPPSIGEDGRLLIDGGILNNMPVDVMSRAGEGPVIAVDVTAHFDFSADHVGERTPRRRARQPRDEWPWDDERPVPTFAETLTRLITIASVDSKDAARLHADLLITPGNDDVGVLEFHQLDRMRDAGRRAALAALEQAPSDVLARLAG
jgi:EmrB/QacA subfamily drug resistance transporter